MPERETGRDRRPIDVRCELREALEERHAAGETRHGLDQACSRVLLHRARKAHEGGAGHDAVAIEDDEMIISPAKALNPILQVSRLAPGVLDAAAVVDRDLSRERTADFRIGGLLGSALLGAARVREDEDVEGCGLAERFQLFGDGADRAGYAGGIFVMDGKEQRGALLDRTLGTREVYCVGFLFGEEWQEAQRGRQRP
jgi:hypothetical protein